MKKELAMAWAAALESGEYKQGRGRLRRGDRFCVLGVACNLHAQAHPHIAARQLTKLAYMGVRTYLPEVVQQWLGMSSRRSEFCFTENGVKYYSLMSANDKGVSFTALAQVIRKNYRKL